MRGELIVVLLFSYCETLPKYCNANSIERFVYLLARYCGFSGALSGYEVQ